MILQIAALILLPLIWPAGIGPLWASRHWTPKDKMIGTIGTLGGYPSVFIAILMLGRVGQLNCLQLGSQTPSCTGWAPYLATLVAAGLLLILPAVTVIYLGLRLRDHPMGC
jgi:hypothetical protein